jgi:hypothetical protein
MFRTCSIWQLIAKILYFLIILFKFFRNIFPQYYIQLLKKCRLDDMFYLYPYHVSKYHVIYDVERVQVSDKWFKWLQHWFACKSKKTQKNNLSSHFQTNQSQTSPSLLVSNQFKQSSFHHPCFIYRIKETNSIYWNSFIWTFVIHQYRLSLIFF